MLKTTRIKDFQSLHDVEIEHGGVTVLTGQSDLGKSAIIRAMRLLHRNNGTASFVRNGKSKLKVEQLFEDGNIVGIEKSKTINNYQVNDKSLAKIGKEVPETVREVLLTDELVLDKDLSCDLNFSGQFDPPFLLTESSTLVTKVISALSGIEIIYSAIREGASQALKLKATSQVLSGNISTLVRFDELGIESEGLQSEVESLQSQEIGLQSSEVFLEKLARLLQKSQVLQAKIVDTAAEEKALQVLVDVKKAIDTQEASIKTLETLKVRVDGLVSPESLDVEAVSELKNKINSIFLLVTKDEIAYNSLLKKQESLNTFEKQLSNTSRELLDLEAEEATIKASVKFCEKCKRPL